jgi:hypothetical protein|tara:strand:- start:425 stop:550 length:126 start_codon:yes stop_codon:yes gene_type:complete
MGFVAVLATGVLLLYYNPDFQEALLYEQKKAAVAVWLCQCY